jgi:hypothetical protein
MELDHGSPGRNETDKDDHRTPPETWLHIRTDKKACYATATKVRTEPAKDTVQTKYENYGQRSPLSQVRPLLEMNLELPRSGSSLVT